MIIIGGDFVPTKSNYDLFENGNIDELFGTELLKELNTSDYKIFNLETPLCDEKSPIIKAGANFSTPTNTVETLKKIGVDLFTLANNHIFDQGEKGLASTRKTLDESNISYVGVGDDLKDASKPVFFEVKGKRYGVYACAEHEFSIATDKTAGANPFDPLESLDHISRAKDQCDFLIVLYHGGKEYYRYPSPLLQKVCHKIIEKGANFVVCQHSHCIGCEEKYQDGTIVYGQGNFLFDNSNHEYWQTSLIVKIEDDNSITYVPIVKNGNTIRKANSEQEKGIMDAFYKRSKEIKVDGFVEENYMKFAETILHSYLYDINGKHSVFFRIIDKLTNHKYSKKYLQRKYGIKENTLLTGFLRCEAHNELFLKGLEKYKNI